MTIKMLSSRPVEPPKAVRASGSRHLPDRLGSNVTEYTYTRCVCVYIYMCVCTYTVYMCILYIYIYDVR